MGVLNFLVPIFPLTFPVWLFGGAIVLFFRFRVTQRAYLRRFPPVEPYMTLDMYTTLCGAPRGTWRRMNEAAGRPGIGGPQARHVAALGPRCRLGLRLPAARHRRSSALDGATRKRYEGFLEALPDARGEVLDLVAEGDKVVVHDRFGGTHRGEFLGRPGTGDRIEWMAIHIYTMRDGKVLEDAYMRDELAILQQLGVAPSAWSIVQLRRPRWIASAHGL